MRPLKLTMTAFGPYPNEEVVDFTELNGKNLFLITGPTGAGKTTIFDGICYAMYGETSGNERNPESLRSHFAEDNLITEVTLEFELKEEKYLIHRTPKQMKKKKRGEGFTEQKPEASMIIDNGVDEKTVITGVSSVNNKVSEIMGINAEQFRQILMIPQGSFRKLLTADSQEREKVLQKIFNTKIYKDLQFKLQIKEKQLKNEIKNSLALRESAVSRIDTFENFALSQMVESDEKNISKIIEKTKNSLELDKEKKKELEEKEKSIFKEVNKLTIEKTKSEENNKKLSRKDELFKEKTLMEARKDEVSQKEKELNLADKAHTIIPVEEIYNDRKIEKVNKEKELKKIIDEFQKSEVSMNSSQEKYKIQSSEESINRRNSLNEKLTVLKSYIDKVRNFDVIKNEKTKFQGQLSKLIERKENIQKVIQGTKDRLENLNKEKDKCQNAAIEYEKLKNFGDKLKEVLSNVNNLSLVERDLAKKSKLFLKETESLKIIKEELENESKEYDDLYNKFIEGQAALLANNLKEGEPCPVCGSTNHTNLAVKGAHLPSEEELKVKRERVQKAQKLFNDRNAMKAALETEGKNAKENLYNRAEELINKIGEFEEIIQNPKYAVDIKKFKVMGLKKIAIFISSLKNFIEEKINQSNMEINEMKKLKEIHSNIEKQIINANENMKKNEEDFEVNEKNLYIANNNFTEAKTKYEEIVKEIPEEFRDGSQLLAEIKEVESLKNKLEHKLEASRKEYENCSKVFVTKKVSKEHIEKELEKSKLVFNKAKEIFKEKVEEAGFDGYKEYINAKRDREWMDSTKKSIEKYFSDLQSIRDRYEELAKNTEGFSLVDISLIQKRIDEKNEFYKEINSIKNKTQNRIENNIKTISDIEEINVKIETKENQYKLIGQLSKIANGSNSSNISFERYVLAAFLDDILVAANSRLRKMTDGRFQLSRTDELERKNKQSGLELEVFDSYTGRSRHVKTLSGGEGFKASLSMALGLSDVVQSYAGGVRLDTMFIDEGFGTLDSESLDNAIECLIDLQRMGRLVGIISHVPELKERIESKLEVVAGNAGSCTRFV
ncbi:SMC family ATPase [Clostridium sediminicola]|uniref:AAA family ATPase n=1 Tax=Clostridium sediminicola TaxID=3114879 RepID=UPI0031F2142D